MKRFIAAIFILGTLTAFNAYSRQVTTQNPVKERAVVELSDKTMIGNVALQGKYIFEHDNDKKARGEACLLIYTIKDGEPGELVASFHCQAVDRPKARSLVVNVAMTSEPNVYRLTEVQFPGSAVAHRVPLG